MISLYLERGSSFSHSVVGSLGSFTRDIIPTDLESLDELACPVMMMPPEHFSLRGYDPESSEPLPFKTLFLLLYSDPPIGIYWPVDIGFDRFLDTVSGPKPYQAFAKLLRDNKAEFGRWFEAAAAKTATMTVTLRAVTTNLWTTFPTPENLDDEQTADTRRVAPFQQQQDSFRWSYYVDCILNGPGTTQEEVLDRQALLSYLGQVEEYNPKPDVPWANCPPSRWPFLPHLFQMTRNSRVTRLLEPFLDVDRSTQVPMIVANIPVIDLSPQLSGLDFHDAQDSHDSGVHDDIEPDFGVRQMVPASPGAQFEHRHNTRQRKRAKTTHPKTARGISPSPLFGDVSPSRTRRRHQGSPQPSMSSTADSATELQVVGVRQAPIAPVTADRSHDRSRRVDFGLTAGRRLDYDDQVYAPPGRPTHTPYALSGPGAGAHLGSPVRTHAPLRGGFAPSPSSQGLGSSMYRTSAAPPAASIPGRPLRGTFHSPPSQSRHGGGAQIWNQQFSNSTLSHQPQHNKKVSMREASIGDVDSCARCPVEWITAALFTVRPIEAGQWRECGSRQMLRYEQFAVVHEPTEFARDNIFSCLDTTSSVNRSTVKNIVISRFNMGPELGNCGRLINADLMGMDDNFLKMLFNVNLWQMRSGAAVLDAEYLHVLDFPRLLNPSLSRLKLPAAGYSLSFTQQVSKLIWVLMSLPCVDLCPDGTLQDVRFYKTEFGAILLALCQAPFNNLLQQWWTKYPRQATTLWIMDLIDLFELFSQFVQVQAGAGLRHTFTLLEDVATHAGPFVTACVELPTVYGGRRENLFSQLRRLRQDFDERWDRLRYNGGERMWSSPLTTELLPVTRVPAPSPAPGSESTRKNKRKKAESESDDLPQPFTASKPLFTFLQPCEGDDTPQLVLRNVANVRDWVQMRRSGDHSSKKGKDAMRQLCFCCAFVAFNHCEDMMKCRLRKTRGIRLHIDLAHTDRWGPTNYPKSNWRPLVAFQRKWSKYIRPTEELKELTIGMDWKLSDEE